MKVFTKKWWVPTLAVAICTIVSLAGSMESGDGLLSPEPKAVCDVAQSSTDAYVTSPNRAAENAHVDVIPSGLRGIFYDFNEDGVLDFVTTGTYATQSTLYLSDQAGFSVINANWREQQGFDFNWNQIYRVGSANVFVAVKGDRKIMTFSVPDMEPIDFVAVSGVVPCDYDNDGRIEFFYPEKNDVYVVSEDGKFSRRVLDVCPIEDLLPKDDNGEPSQSEGSRFITMDFSMLSAGYLFSQMFAGGGSSGASAIGDNTFRSVDVNGDGLTDMVNFRSGTIYYNLGDGRYCTDTFKGSMFFADFNGDGIEDYVLYSDNAISTNLVNPDGSVTSKKVITGFQCANIWCRDVDNDGDSDLVLSLEGAQNFIVVLENDGKGSFRRREYAIASDLKDFRYCVDCDNDGNYEIMTTTAALKITGTKVDVNPVDLKEMAGVPSNLNVSQVFINPSDGKTYLLTGGNGASNNLLGHCIAANANAVPTAPAKAPEFIYEASTGLLKISWERGSDAETPSADLTYAMRIGSERGKDDIMSALALPDGSRVTSCEGNNGTRLQRIIDTSSWPEGSYYIAVQTVDGNFVGSPFSAEAEFEKKEPDCAFSMIYKPFFAINDTLTLKLNRPESASLTYNWSIDGGVIVGKCSEKGETYVVFNEYGDKKITLQTTSKQGAASRSFSREISVFPIPLHNSLKVDCDVVTDEAPRFIAALDMDEDGMLEPFYRMYSASGRRLYGFMSGDKRGNYTLIPKMFNNNLLIGQLARHGVGTFDINGDGLCDYVATDQKNWRVKNLVTNLGELDMDFDQAETDKNIVSWVDFDNDGKYDGVANYNIDYHKYYTPIYRNDGNYKSFNSKQLKDHILLYDFNGDGLLDIVLGEYEWNAGVLSYGHWIYLNNGDFTCSKYLPLGEPVSDREGEVMLRYVDDFDCNGKYDVIYSTGGKLYIKWDNGTISELQCSDTNNLFSVFDYDNNGCPDLCCSNREIISFYPGQRCVNCYVPSSNDEYGTSYGFIGSAPFRLTSGKLGTVEGHDNKYNDFYESNAPTRLINVTNEAPSAPTALRHSQNEKFVVIEWNHSVDKETPAAQMRYNLSVKHKGGRR